MIRINMARSRRASAYNKFVGKLMREGKSMKEAAKAWKHGKGSRGSRKSHSRKRSRKSRSRSRRRSRSHSRRKRSRSRR